MSLSITNKKRLLIPRWRNYSKALMTGELFTPANDENIDRYYQDSFLKLNQSIWEVTPNLETAVEIVYFAITTGCNDVAIEQAKYILKSKEKIKVEVIELANSILKDSKATFDLNLKVSFSLKKEQIYSEISLIKFRLKEWPKNAILWAELSRLYAIISEVDKSKKAADISCLLDINNRFVVRGAIRCFTHFSDMERLKKLFKNLDTKYSDPWLLAPYISLHGELVGSNLKVKKLNNLVNKVENTQVTELAAAFGTLELEAGSIKNAKKLFRKSMLAPNDNSLAQMTWASKQLGGTNNFNVSNFEIPYLHEAKSRERLLQNKYTEALDSCRSWISDEPFSSVPATFGSSIAVSFLSDMDSAKIFCEIGLQANPNDPMLLNNYAVVLAKSGKLKEAYSEFSKIRNIQENSRMAVTALATSGLLLLRAGEVDAGREKYNESIELAKKLGDHDLQAMAAIHFAIEEAEMGVLKPEIIKKIVDSNLKETKDTSVLFLKEKFEKQLN